MIQTGDGARDLGLSYAQPEFQNLPIKANDFYAGVATLTDRLLFCNRDEKTWPAGEAIPLNIFDMETVAETILAARQTFEEKWR